MLGMNNKALKEENEREYTPEEAALTMRLRVFVTMRWITVIGIIIAALVASMVIKISFPTLPVYATAAVIALYNLVLLWQLRRLEAKGTDSIIQMTRTFGNIHLFLDLIALTVLLHFTGGIENPFIFYFVLHITAASISLHYRVVYMLATSALLMVALLVGLEYAGAIPHINLVGFAAPTLYREGSYILAILVALASLLYATAYMVTAISGELRKRQRQVMQLREQLIEEKSGELERASGEITKLETEKNRFLHFIGIAAHDLKAPLTAIQGFLWVMLGGYAGELTDKQKNMLERSSLRIKELLNLISDLLDIPRIETGQIVPEMKLTSLRQVIKHSCDDMRNQAQEKGIRLKTELPEALPKVYGSAPRLQQVMTNLLDNAIRYTPKGDVAIRVKEEKRYVQVEVTDTGIGIPPEDLSHVFDDFFRASNVDTKGTGLGLAISKRIVEAHGGKIWVESPCPETNHGSKFAFTLSKKRAKLSRDNSLESRNVPKGGSRDRRAATTAEVDSSVSSNSW
jgi:signal transduction histidine kinase